MTILQDGIEPMWEDKKNKEGGRWLINTSKQQRQSELDRIWLETVSWDSIVDSAPCQIYGYAHYWQTLLFWKNVNLSTINNNN